MSSIPENSKGSLVYYFREKIITAIINYRFHTLKEIDMM